MNERSEPTLTVTEDRDAVVLSVVVTPRSSKTEIAAIGRDAIRVRLSAPPADGKANATLVKFLAMAIGVPERHVEIVAGSTSRRKRVRVETDMGAERLTALLRHGLD